MFKEIIDAWHWAHLVKDDGTTALTIALDADSVDDRRAPDAVDRIRLLRDMAQSLSAQGVPIHKLHHSR